MAATELKMTLLLRRAEFSNTCVLQEGEPGFNTKTHEFKIGQKDSNGNLIQWKDLPLANETQIKDWIEAVRADLQDKLDTLDATYVTDTDFLSYQQAMEELLGEFPIGTGDGKYTDIKAYIDAMDAAERAYAAGQLSAAEGRINEKIGTKGETSNTTVYGAITAEKVARETAIGTASDARNQSTVYGAIAKEAYDRDQADQGILDKIGNIGTNTTVGARLDAADLAASNAQSSADAAGQAIDLHKDDNNNPHEVTKAQVGLGNVDDKSVATIKSEFTGSIAENNTGFVTGGAVYAADKALDDKISSLETRIGNVTNVMNFRGAVETFTAVTDPVEGDVITFSKEFKDGDAIVAKVGSEWVYSTGEWIEIGTASASDAAIAALQSRMDAAEEDISENTSAITTLGTNKVNVSDFNTWKQSHEQDHANKQTAITSAIATAKSEAITKADELDTALHTVISKEIDDDVKAAIDAEVTRSDAKAKELADAAETAAKNYADSQDTALKTAIEGTSTDESSKATIAGAKKYAEEKASAAETNAKNTVIGASTDTKTANTVYGAKAFATDTANTVKSDVIGTDSDTKTSDTIKGAKKYADDAASTAKSEAISAVVGTANDGSDADTINGVRAAFAAADTAVLTAAQNYTDKAVKENILAGNDDIVVSVPTSGDNKDKTVVSHKVYGTGSYTAPTEVKDTHFVTGVNVYNGHVTGATVKSLAEALEAMEFIFDGGTSAN